jgi:DNA-binding IclR family transcriptional regulator
MGMSEVFAVKNQSTQVSAHEVRIYDALIANKDQWLMGREIAQKSGVVPRTTRAHLVRFVELGIVEQAEVYPGPRYRWSERACRRNAEYISRIEAAKAVLQYKG